MALFVLLLRVGVVATERVYTMDIAGCDFQEFTLSNLADVQESQRKVWESFGNERPWWSVLSSPEYDKPLEDDETRKFYDSGEEAVRRALLSVSRAVARYALPWAGGGLGSTALDFGCGVGRLAKALTNRFGTVICVDHSFRHLDVARRTMDRLWPLSGRRLVPFGLERGDVEAISRHFSRGSQFVLSLITLQHMIPQLQVVAVENLCDALESGGTGFVQLLTGYSEAPYVKENNCDPRLALSEPGMHLHYLPLEEMYRHLRLRGCSPVAELKCDDHVFIPDRDSTSHCVVFSRGEQHLKIINGTTIS